MNKRYQVKIPSWGVEVLEDGGPEPRRKTVAALRCFATIHETDDVLEAQKIVAEIRCSSAPHNSAWAYDTKTLLVVK